MFILKKCPHKDFIILNLTDPQLGDPEWEEGHLNRAILEYTVTQLIQRVQPDLITVSGDLAWAGYDHAYEMIAQLLESFQIPWAPIWGNHDNQNGAEYINKIVDKYLTYPHCLYEKGNPALGNGNYVIGIEENGKLVEAIFMVDSHNQDAYVNEKGEEQKAWAKLTPAQIDWYRQQVQSFKEQGCRKSTMILHIPIYAYNTASRAAYKDTVNLAELTLAQAEGCDCWQTGYETSVGVQHEGIASYPADDGVFAAIKEENFTQYIIAGHDHVNNWIIRYDGVTFIYALKTGAGCYWDAKLNGGTVLKVNENGVYDVHHEYVDVSHLLK